MFLVFLRICCHRQEEEDGHSGSLWQFSADHEFPDLVPRAAAWRLCHLLFRMGWSTRPWSHLKSSTWQWPMTGFSLGRHDKFYLHVHPVQQGRSLEGSSLIFVHSQRLMSEQLPVTWDKKGWCFFFSLKVSSIWLFLTACTLLLILACDWASLALFPGTC